MGNQISNDGNQREGKGHPNHQHVHPGVGPYHQPTSTQTSSSTNRQQNTHNTQNQPNSSQTHHQHPHSQPSQGASPGQGPPPGPGVPGGHLPGQQPYNPHSAYGAPTSSSRPSRDTNNMNKSGSDTSMTMHDDKPEEGGPSNTASNTPNQGSIDMADLSASDDDVVPTVFRWEHGGREVYITGTFNDWTRQIPMHRSGNDFTYIHNLKRGKHAFKFIVDDEWRFAPDQPTVADIDGRINNFIDVTDFKAYTGDKSFETEKNAAYYSKSHHKPPRDATSNAPSSHDHSAPMTLNEDEAMNTEHANHQIPTMDDPDGEVFTHNMPDLDEYTKDPPPLPPHLRHIILNKPPQLQDTAALPVPQHVALNHLYCTAIRDNMMVLGITQRFRTKFVTTVYYSPELSSRT